MLCDLSLVNLISYDEPKQKLTCAFNDIWQRDVKSLSAEDAVASGILGKSGLKLSLKHLDSQPLTLSRSICKIVIFVNINLYGGNTQMLQYTV